MWFIDVLVNLIEEWIDLLQSKSTNCNNNTKYVKIEDVNRLKEKVRKIKNDN